jgi:hypothetical protein
MAGSGAPCPEPKGLKAHRPVSSAGVQLPAAGLSLASALNSQIEEHPMTNPARADRQAPPACAHETATPTIVDIDNPTSAPIGAAVQSSRRRFLMNSVVSVASLSSAAAIASPSSVPGIDDADVEIANLWKRYLESMAHIDRTENSVRHVYQERDAALEMLPKGLPWAAHQAAYDALITPETEAGFNAMQAAWSTQDEIIRAIHRYPARTPFAFAVKLAAMPRIGLDKDAADEDFRDAAIGVMRDIDAMLGTEFAKRHDHLWTDCLVNQGLDDDDDDDGETAPA